MTRPQSKSSAFFLFFLAVALSVLCQPSFLFEDGLPLLAWPAYIPFFLLTERLSVRESWVWGFFYGFVSYLCMCWWLSAFGAAAVSFVCALFAFYHALLFFVLSLSKKIFPERAGRFFWIFRALLLVSFDFLRARGIFGFSYGIVGYSQWRVPAFLRFSSLFGVGGVSLLIFMIGSLAARVISERSLRANMRALSVCAAVLLSVLLHSLLPARDSDPETLPVALIQNASSSESRTIAEFERDADVLKSLTDSALAQSPDVRLVVWAETAVVPDILYNSTNQNDGRRRNLSNGLLDYINGRERPFLIGNNHTDADGAHNSALYFPGGAGEVGVYDKNHLVPFTEYWPDFLDYKIFDGIKNRLDCEFFEHGKEIRTFALDGLRFAVPICFEDSFAPLVREMRLCGADFFVNISNDAWAKSPAARKMHLSMGAFRCAEFRTPMIRATIDGVTCVIDRNGAVVSEIAGGEDGFLCARVEVYEKSCTLYLLTGDTPALIVTLLNLILLLILSLRFVKVSAYGRR